MCIDMWYILSRHVYFSFIFLSTSICIDVILGEWYNIINREIFSSPNYQSGIQNERQKETHICMVPPLVYIHGWRKKRWKYSNPKSEDIPNLTKGGCFFLITWTLDLSTQMHIYEYTEREITFYNRSNLSYFVSPCCL